VDQSKLVHFIAQIGFNRYIRNEFYSAVRRKSPFGYRYDAPDCGIEQLFVQLDSIVTNQMHVAIRM